MTTIKINTQNISHNPLHDVPFLMLSPDAKIEPVDIKNETDPAYRLVKVLKHLVEHHGLSTDSLTVSKLHMISGNADRIVLFGRVTLEGCGESFAGYIVQGQSPTGDDRLTQILSSGYHMDPSVVSILTIK
ncbi:MAG TPA: hypothetical protein VIH22_10960, partial [Cyclobacteriaceae bacterium]